LLRVRAWYAIIKNNLFEDSEYICILEYDVNLNHNFFDETRNACSDNDVIAFLGGSNHWNSDIDMNVMNSFISEKKHISYNSNNHWYYTTNMCMRRTVLADFVGWYYPDYQFIKERHPVKLSWYHERLFSVFISDRKFKVKQIGGLHHFQNNSHNGF